LTKFVRLKAWPVDFWCHFSSLIFSNVTPRFVRGIQETNAITSRV